MSQLFFVNSANRFALLSAARETLHSHGVACKRTDRFRFSGQHCVVKVYSASVRIYAEDEISVIFACDAKIGVVGSVIKNSSLLSG